MYVKRTVLQKFDDVARIIRTESDSRDCEVNTSVFTSAELDYCSERLRCLGARFMIKECIFNYIEGEMGCVEKNYREIEIVNNELRRPTIRLFNGISNCAGRLKIKDILISISHSREWITGMVLFCY